MNGGAEMIEDQALSSDGGVTNEVYGYVGNDNMAHQQYRIPAN